LLLASLLLGPAGPAAAATDLPFSEMFAMPVGPRGLEATPRLRSLEGQPVLLAGHMVRRDVATPGSFVIAPVPVSIGDEDEGKADDLPPSAVFVHLAPGFEQAQIPYTPGAMRITGTLRTGPALERDGRVSSVRLLLDESTSLALLKSVPSRGNR
jgi:hypothetical protein